MITFRPLLMTGLKKLGRLVPDLECAAVEQIELAPSSQRYIRPAVFLPGQIERISGTEFGTRDEVVRDFQGGFDSTEAPTVAYRMKSVDLVDGALYAKGAVKHLKVRNQRIPIYRQPTNVGSGAIFESWLGNRWFGNWLQDDCLTYPLASQFGTPFTTRVRPGGHVPEYESVLGMMPLRSEHAHFEELTVFCDFSHNESRRARSEEFRKKLIATSRYKHHAGVFLLRGTTGDKRVLLNERAAAEHLAAKYGLQVLDPSTASLEQIIEACAGARTIVGVEGSHLVHGLMIMPANASLLVIQPPTRTVSVLKFVTDRQGQTYAFVVGKGSDQEFSVSIEELERTLDLAHERSEAA
ncbi:MAG: glycosyltransferase family 61 protein [Pseudomonadota bacterium]